MNEKEKRIALAESCGWTEIKEYHYFDADGIDGFPPGYVECEGFDKDFFRNEIPDYFNDLNATHKVEENLNFNQRTKYVIMLGDIMSDKGLWEAVHATAAQRAESLFKIIVEENEN